MGRRLEYEVKTSVRLNMSNPQHVKINDVIQNLDPKIFKSKNQFIIDAIQFYIDNYGKEEYYFYEEGRIKEVITKEYRLIYRYVGEEVKGVTYKNENKEISYFYEKNILGEIIGIVDEEGKRVVEYRSSSYGEVENIHDNSKIEISAKDHLRYKDISMMKRQDYII